VLYDQTIGAINGTGNKTMTYLVTAGAFPAGLMVSTSVGDPGTLTIAGTPSAAGTVTFNVTGTDIDGVAGTESYTLTINAPISLSPLSLPGGYESVAYDQTIAANAGTGSKAMAWSILSGSLPTGLTITTNTSDPGTLAITGTPTSTGAVSFQ